MAYSYGKCPCGGEYRSRTVEVTFRRQITLSKVPQGCCPKCDSRVYKAEVMELLESVMKGTTREEPLPPNDKEVAGAPPPS